VRPRISCQPGAGPGGAPARGARAASRGRGSAQGSTGTDFTWSNVPIHGTAFLLRSGPAIVAELGARGTRWPKPADPCSCRRARSARPTLHRDRRCVRQRGHRVVFRRRRRGKGGGTWGFEEDWSTWRAPAAGQEQDAGSSGRTSSPHRARVPQADDRAAGDLDQSRSGRTHRGGAVMPSSSSPRSGRGLSRM